MEKIFDPVFRPVVLVIGVGTSSGIDEGQDIDNPGDTPEDPFG